MGYMGSYEVNPGLCKGPQQGNLKLEHIKASHRSVKRPEGPLMTSHDHLGNDANSLSQYFSLQIQSTRTYAHCVPFLRQDTLPELLKKIAGGSRARLTVFSKGSNLLCLLATPDIL